VSKRRRLDVSTRIAECHCSQKAQHRREDVGRLAIPSFEGIDWRKSATDLAARPIDQLARDFEELKSQRCGRRAGGVPSSAGVDRFLTRLTGKDLSGSRRTARDIRSCYQLAMA